MEEQPLGAEQGGEASDELLVRTKAWKNNRWELAREHAALVGATVRTKAWKNNR